MSLLDKRPIIYIFLPYFGRMPNYFQLYLDSMVANHDILRVVLLTDVNMEKYKLPSNLIIFNLSFEKLREKAISIFKKKLDPGIDESRILTNPYKICDYRPLFYLLFDDYIRHLKIRVGIDYLGFGDCDVIYGKLSEFIDFNKHYIVIGGKGHFSVVLFEKQYLEVWKLCQGYKYCHDIKEILLSDRPRFFDENIYLYRMYDYLKHSSNLFFSIL